MTRNRCCGLTAWPWLLGDPKPVLSGRTHCFTAPGAAGPAFLIAPETPMRFDPSLRPVLAAALGVALFSGLDAMMKIIAGAYPLGQATGMRYVAGALVATAYYAFADGQIPTSGAIRRSLPRALANLAGGAFFFLALARLSLTDAVALTFLSPLFLAVWARILLREPLRPMILGAMAIGIVGVFVIARGQLTVRPQGLDPVGIAAALSCAASYALSMVLTRRQSREDGVPTLVLLPSLLGALVSAPFMLSSWQPPALFHLALLAIVGIAGTAGYLCLTWAYANARVARLGLLEYSGLLWAALFGYAIFSEIPPASTLIGTALILVACFPSFKRESGPAEAA